MPRSMHIIGSKLSGGAERFYVRLVHALHQRGEAVVAVNPAASRPGAELGAQIPQAHAPMSGPWDLWSRWRISQLALRCRPQIVQTYMTRATQLTRLARGQIPVHVARLGGYYKLKSYRHAHAWVGNTQGICDYLVSNGLPAQRVYLIGNFIDPAEPVPKDRLNGVRKELDIPADAWVVVSVGRLHPNKGFADLLEAVALLPRELAGRPLFLTLVGAGSLRRDLEQLAQRLGIAARVRWTGWQEEPGAYYQLADLFVSAARHEPLGNVILEAWAHRAPVVATRTAGAQELITDGQDGVLAPLADPKGLSATLRDTLRAPPAWRHGLAENGLRVLNQHHGRAAVVDAYLDMYRTLLRGG